MSARSVAASGRDLDGVLKDGQEPQESKQCLMGQLLAGCSDLKRIMGRMGHAQIQTRQTYLDAPPDADQKNLDALSRIAGKPRQQPS